MFCRLFLSKLHLFYVLLFRSANLCIELRNYYSTGKNRTLVVHLFIELACFNGYQLVIRSSTKPYDFVFFQLSEKVSIPALKNKIPCDW